MSVEFFVADLCLPHFQGEMDLGPLTHLSPPKTQRKSAAIVITKLHGVSGEALLSHVQPRGKIAATGRAQRTISWKSRSLFRFCARKSSSECLVVTFLHAVAIPFTSHVEKSFTNQDGDISLKVQALGQATIFKYSEVQSSFSCRGHNKSSNLCRPVCPVESFQSAYPDIRETR